MPKLLANIAPADEGSQPAEFTGVGSEVFFAARGSELWKTDGTSHGTVRVKDLGAGVGQIHLEALHNHNGLLVFMRVDAGLNSAFFARDDDRVQLWKSDGTSGGTQLVRDFGIGSYTGISDGAHFVSLNDTLFTALGTTSTGVELWKSNLTSAGTMMVKDINPGDAGSDPNYLLNHNGTLFFAADDGVNGRELWKSDGTLGGTRLVKDIETVNSVGSYPGFYPNGFVVKGDSFFFGVRSSGSDRIPFNDDDSGQLWKSDGTVAGTKVVKDFGAGSYGYIDLLNVGGTLFGVVQTAAHGSELWKSDGTAQGTVLVKDINPAVESYGASSSYPRLLTDVNGTLFFVADDGVHGEELWKSDGTTAGTVLVKDINSTSEAYGSYPYSLVNADGILFFTADDGSHGEELWMSDGTSAGTVLVKDINSSSVGSDSAYIYSMRFINGLLFFGADDGTHGFEPWVFDPFVECDFGDAPESYGTLAANDGARHAIGDPLFLGARVDSESDGQPNVTATGDDQDATPNDEDGVIQSPRFIAGATASVEVLASADGMLDAWLDLNGNGVFDQPAEHIGAGTSVAVNGGSNTLTFAIPSDAKLGATYARIRISSAGGLEPGGLADDGEVEDYHVAIRLSTTVSDWQNLANLLDANGDESISPIDALVIINSINDDGSRALGEHPAVPEFWYDVNGDTFISPLDPLIVINELNAASGEGEHVAGTSSTAWETGPIPPQLAFQRSLRREKLTAASATLATSVGEDADGGDASGNEPQRTRRRGSRPLGEPPVVRRVGRARLVADAEDLDQHMVNGLEEIAYDISVVWRINRR